MDKLNQEDLNKTANKVGLFFILNILSLVIVIPILSNVGIYNVSTNGFLFNMGFIFIIGSLLFPLDLKRIFIRNKKINILVGIFYVFLFLSIYLPLGIITSKLLSPLYYGVEVQKQFTIAFFIIQGITIPIVEEIVFKGILLENLRKHGDIFAIVISSLIFGMMHGFRVINSSIFGLFTGFLYVRSNKLFYPILFHLMTDLFYILLLEGINNFFPIININIATLIVTTISIVITFILYIMIKIKGDSDIKKIKTLKIKKLILLLKKDKQKYLILLQEKGVIVALTMFFIITAMEIIVILSKLK